MTAGAPPRPSRAIRTGARRRRDGLFAAGLAVLVLAAFLVWRWGPDGPAATITTAPTPSGRPAALLVLSVTGGADAFVAVVGSGGGRPPAAAVMEPGLTVVAPGQGDRTVEDLADGGGEALRAAVSNAIGTWAHHYGVMDVTALGAVVERVGSVAVNLPDAYPVGSVVLGPGETDLDARQVVALLDEPGDDAVLRFFAVLEGLLASSASIQQTDLSESDDPTAAAAIVGTARNATVELAPAEIVAGSVLVPSQPDFDAMMTTLFGTSPPVRAIVQNGSGSPGVGVAVAERLLPHGFRIVISGNAESFDHARTEITAHGPDHEDDAIEAQEQLGVGTVTVSDVASGFADVTIVVGKDFTP